MSNPEGACAKEKMIKQDNIKKVGVITGIKIEQEKTCTPSQKNDPLFVGIDHSFNGTAIIVLDKNACIVENILYKSKGDNDVEKLVDIEKAISFIPNIISLERVYIEAPSLNSKGANALQMGALHFMIATYLHKHNVSYKAIEPTKLKKFTSGKGNAKKELMLLNVYKKWGVEFNDNNSADAYSLARMALEDYKGDAKHK